MSGIRTNLLLAKPASDTHSNTDPNKNSHPNSCLSFLRNIR